ncbi:Lysine-specific histone demethylase 1 homolog 1 [Linum perenne]
METPAEPPQGPPPPTSGHTFSDHSSPSTEATPSPTRPANHSIVQQNSERLNSTSSPLPLDLPISDSQDESSDPAQLEPVPANPTEPAPPPRKRRRRKRFFTELNNGNPSLRNRYRIPGGRSKELDVEGLIAISVGFPADSLTEEEIEANVVQRIGGTEQSNYIVVRNHILARWRSNVTDWLTREQAHESIRAEHGNLVDSAYDFLLQHGYINFGVTNSITEAQLKLNEEEREKARQLRTMGFKVLILEGRSRPGGRVKTMRLKGGDGVEAAADVGGSVLTGINGNPLGVLARQLGLPVSFNKLLDRVCKLRQAMIEEVKSADVNLGTALEAFRHAYKDDPYEMGGDHCFIPGGNETFVKELAKDLPIFYDRVVESIRYGVDGVLVDAGGQEFRGDMKGSIEFIPELPLRKRDAIQRLGYGLLNKVALLYSNMRGEFFLIYSYSSVSGGPLLIALVAGDAAVKFETMSPVESVRRVLQILRGIFHPKGIVVPDPGSSGDDYDLLAESVGDGRVFFAGEATNKQYPATMHGAFLSGMREAANMLRVAKKRSLVLATSKSNVDEADRSSELDKLYETPDLVFGSFSILFNPQSSDHDSQCLLRVKIRGGDSEGCFISLYALVLRKQAMELSEEDGDDDKKRLEKLCQKFQVRLVGRKGLCNEGESLVAEIKAARSNMDVGN